MIIGTRFAALLFVPAAIFLLLAQAAPAADTSRTIKISTTSAGPQHVMLRLDKAVIVELDRYASDVLVSNPQIADAVVRSPRRIFIIAQKVGQTNAFFFDGAGRQIAALDIRVERDVADLGQAIVRHMPDSQVNVEALNDNVVLDGTVQSARDADAAQELAARFAGDPKKVVNMLKVEQRQQVLIKVRISEMSRSVAKQLGIDISSITFPGRVPLIFQTSNPFGLLGRALSDASGGKIGDITKGQNIEGTLKALEQVGLVRTLAEPNLTAVSGESAKFLAGGEFPVPTSRDQLGNVVVTFKQFGVGLAFTPVVLSGGRISLQVSTEVSELTTQGAFIQTGSTSTDSEGNTFTTEGLTVPALSVRRAETTVEMPSGASLVIGGLLQRQTKQTLDAFPGLKDLPVLGALFRSRDFSNNETELVVMVTAYLVDPTHEQQIAMPDDGYVPPSDLDTILMGRLNTVYGKGYPEAQTSAKGKAGYIIQ
ncbi:MAG: type II and III secretion system protein family protein [Alphaproteobacteria bacterium]